VTTKLQEIYMTCCAEKKQFFFWGGGLVVCSRGELGWGRRRRNKGGESRQSGHIFCDSIGYSDGKQGTSLYGNFGLNFSIIPSAFQTVNRSRHRTDLPF